MAKNFAMVIFIQCR